MSCYKNKGMKDVGNDCIEALLGKLLKTHTDM